MSDYLTVSDFKARAYPEGIIDSVNDVVIGNVIEGVSRLIDTECQRQFFTTANTTMYFTRVDPFCVLIADFTAITTVATDDAGDRTYSATWASSDYDLEPYNAPLLAQPEPYTKIVVSPNGGRRFPDYTRGVKVVGTYGYSASIPAQIREACFIQSYRVFKRKDAPFGVMGNTELGESIVIARLDPDVKALLRAFKRRVLL